MKSLGKALEIKIGYGICEGCGQAHDMSRKDGTMKTDKCKHCYHSQKLRVSRRLTTHGRYAPPRDLVETEDVGYTICCYCSLLECGDHIGWYSQWALEQARRDLGIPKGRNETYAKLTPSTTAETRT